MIYIQIQWNYEAETLNNYATNTQGEKGKIGNFSREIET